MMAMGPSPGPILPADTGTVLQPAEKRSRGSVTLDGRSLRDAQAVGLLLSFCQFSFSAVAF